MWLIDGIAERAAKKAVGDMAKQLGMPGADGLENVVAGLGTSRDKRAHTRYALPITMVPQDLSNMYRTSWIAKKVVNVPADDMTRAWRTVEFDEDSVEEREAVEATERELGLQNKVNEALRMARLFGGAAIILVVGNELLDTPLDPETVVEGALKRLVVLDRWQLTAGSVLVTDPTSESFGMPEFYTISLTSQRVHHTRVVRFSGERIPFEAWKMNGYWDDSVLAHVYTAATDADGASASVAALMYEANVDVIKTPGLATRLSTKNGETQVINRYQVGAMMKSVVRVLMLDKEEDYDRKSAAFSGLADIMEKFVVNVTAAADIPVTRFMGTSAKGMSATGEGDLTNYYNGIANKQNAELREPLMKIDRILVRSATGAFPDDYAFTFNPLWQMSEAEEANVEKTRSERDKAYLDMGIISPYVIAQQLKADGTYSQLTTEDVEALKELVPPVLEEPEEPEVDPKTGEPLEAGKASEPNESKEEETDPQAESSKTKRETKREAAVKASEKPGA